jgi:hypothetical protein
MGRCELLILACGVFGGMVHGAHAAGIEPIAGQREVGRIEIASPTQPVAPGDDRPALVPTTIEYQWVFRVPVVSLEHRRIVITAPTASTHARRFDYEAPTLRDKRLKLWSYPEFSCKYPDLILPNECRTVWRGVYVDVPVLASGRARVDVDVPQISLTEQSIVVDIPRWTWTEKRFRFSLPAVAPAASVERLRIALNGQRAAMASAADDAIATLTREIAAVQASGDDPSKLVSGDGSSLDLLAQRQSLQEQRAQELERLADIDAELAHLSAR